MEVWTSNVSLGSIVIKAVPGGSNDNLLTLRQKEIEFFFMKLMKPRTNILINFNILYEIRSANAIISYNKN